MHKQLYVMLGALMVSAFGLTAQEAAPAAPAAPPPVAAGAPAVVTDVPAEPAVQTVKPDLPEIAIAPGSQLISVVLDDVPLQDVVKLFTKISSANIIAATTNLQGNVTANLQDVAWRPAFEAILERQGLLLVEKPADSNIFVIEARPAGVEPRVTETVQLKFAKVDKLTELLKSMLGTEGTVTPFPDGNAILLQASQQKITEARKVVEALDRPRSQVYIEARFVEMTAAASKRLGMKWNFLGSADGWGLNFKNLNAGAEVNNGDIATYEVNGKTIGYSGATIAPDLNPFNGTKTAISIPMPVKDTPTVYLYPEDQTAAPGAGRPLDSMTWKSANGIGGQVSLGNFGLLLNAFEGMGGVTVISNPKIIVANEELATIDMTTKIPYVKLTANRNTADGVNTLDVTPELGTIPGKNETFVGEAFFSYGITLKVTPRVSSTGVITVNIEPTISDSSEDYVIPGSNADMPTTRYPIITMKRINTTFSMQDGATAVIGGLTISKENNDDNGIPLLRKIPFIGPRLFGWKGRVKDQAELLIFVTVGIVDPEKAIDVNVGMPKNAVLSRSLKEPGDGTKEELLLLKP